MKGIKFCFLLLAFFTIDAQAEAEKIKSNQSGSHKSKSLSSIDESDAARFWVKRTIEKNRKIGIK